MTWDEAFSAWHQKYGRRIKFREFEVMTDYPWEGYSIDSLWSHRGEIWKKYAKSYPHPHEVGLDAEHPFFKPGLVCISQVQDRNLNVVYEQHFRRGRCIYDSRKDPFVPSYAPRKRA